MKPMTAAPREALPTKKSETRVARTMVGLTTLRELFAIVVVLLGAAVLLVLVQAVEYVAPFVYTVF
jgi:hypothetical protein